jgi:hypothetical protein
LHRHERAIAELSSGNGMQLQPSPMTNQRDPTIFRQTSQHIPRPETALFIQKSNNFPNQPSYHPDFGGIGHQRATSLNQPNSYQTHTPTDSLNSADLPGLQATSRDLYNQPNPAVHSPTLNLPEALPPPPTSAPNIPQNEFPDHDLCYQLVDLFFKHINTWCPILHRKTTIDVLFGSSPLKDEEKVLLHAMIATTLRYSTDLRLTDETRQKQHQLSKERVQLYGMECSSVRALQALVILTLDLVGDSNGPPGWNMLALISRQCVQLGLAVESNSLSIAPIYPSIYTLRAMVLPDPRDFIEEESRRRLFWVIYLLDRYATIATAFDFTLADKEIDRRLPCREDYFSNNQAVEAKWFGRTERMDATVDKPEYLGSFSYYIEVVGILSRIHQFLKKPVDIGALSDVEKWQREYRELDSELQSWKYGLPQEYSNMSRVFNPGSKNKVVNCGWIMLHAAFYTWVFSMTTQD